MKIIKSLEESGLLLNFVNKIVKTETKEQWGGFLSMLLGTLDVSLLEFLLKSRGDIRGVEGTIWEGEGKIAKSQEQGTIRGGQDFQLTPDRLTNF